VPARRRRQRRLHFGQLHDLYGADRDHRCQLSVRIRHSAGVLRGERYLRELSFHLQLHSPVVHPHGRWQWLLPGCVVSAVRESQQRLRRELRCGVRRSPFLLRYEFAVHDVPGLDVHG
jgi:hypothetical protein